MIARLLRTADFERVLRSRSRLSSQHFAVHHVAEAPRPALARLKATRKRELSTGFVAEEPGPVDDLPVPALLEGCWLGAVVPKRHARRSVTRSLLKRQIRSVAAALASELSPGLWVVRLRAPFDPARFASAASDELRALARGELETLLGGAARRSRPGP
ncbi:MAG: ribonuclease P protein component [Pseudomonadota bacterium]|nr:ribonuclease P protein component [Pseudomonadota bacterium]